MGDQEELVTFKKGKIVCGRWKVAEKLGSGGCGAVYEVSDVTRKGRFYAALKVESNNSEDGGVLKLEAEVLRKLTDSKHCIRLLHAGKRAKYSFITMTLCGPDLMYLKRIEGKNKNKREPDRFSPETIVRIGVQALYQIKAVHEVGFVHRDVKPGNMVVGAAGRDARTFFLIDFGMVREFVVKKEKGGGLAIRKARKKCLLRGTLRYCSMNVHKRMEQGRVDDLWSLLYMLVELLVGLPWSSVKEEQPLRQMKAEISDEKLFEKCPPEFKHSLQIAKHLRTLKYEDRPNYKLIYDRMMGGVHRLGTSFSKPYDWEDEDELVGVIDTALSHSEGRKKPPTAEELEHKLYPTTHPKHFEENRLGV